MTRIANAITEREEHDGIEISSELIEAGQDEIASYNPEFESDEDAVQRIYLAMIRAMLRGKSARQSTDL
jgi:hypothetical protein